MPARFSIRDGRLSPPEIEVPAFLRVGLSVTSRRRPRPRGAARRADHAWSCRFPPAGGRRRSSPACAAGAGRSRSTAARAGALVAGAQPGRRAPGRLAPWLAGQPGLGLRCVAPPRSPRRHMSDERAAAHRPRRLPGHQRSRAAGGRRPRRGEAADLPASSTSCGSASSGAPRTSTSPRTGSTGTSASPPRSASRGCTASSSFFIGEQRVAAELGPDDARGARRGHADLPLHADRRRGAPRRVLRPLLRGGRRARGRTGSTGAWPRPAST